MFWKIVKPFCSNKTVTHSKKILLDKNLLVTENGKVAEILKKNSEKS